MSDADRARPLLTHPGRRSRGCRWVQDDVTGVGDDGRLLCLSLALWNRDPILQDLLLGLSHQGFPQARPAPAGRRDGRRREGTGSMRPTTSNTPDSGEEAPT